MSSSLWLSIEPCSSEIRLLLAVQVRDLRGPSEPDGRKVTLLRSWAVAAVAPFERATSFIGRSTRGMENRLLQNFSLQVWR